MRQIPRPDSPTSAKERARSAERSRYLQRSTLETQRVEEKRRSEFAPRPQSASAALDRKMSTAQSTVATVKEEPTTFMRDLGLGGGSPARDARSSYSVLYEQTPRWGWGEAVRQLDPVVFTNIYLSAVAG